MRGATPLRALLGLQLVFMLGFSSVVPFFAAIGQSRYGLDAAAIVLVGLAGPLFSPAVDALRPAHELRHHPKCTPAAAGTGLEKERIP